LIEHNTDILLKYLAAVITNRHSGTGGSRAIKAVDHSQESKEIPPPIDSVADVIIFPNFDPYRRREKANFAELTVIRPILFDYVTEIAGMYKDVPFHNFEHASHVTLAATVDEQNAWTAWTRMKCTMRRTASVHPLTHLL
jgi:hypothetical protein